MKVKYRSSQNLAKIYTESIKADNYVHNSLLLKFLLEN